jgi:hypothetical protein
MLSILITSEIILKGKNRFERKNLRTKRLHQILTFALNQSPIPEQ